VDVPVPLDDSSQVLIGDVHPRPGTELVVIAQRGVSVHGIQGRVLSHVELSESLLTPGVLVDIDQDRTLDIVTGTRRGNDPLVRAFDGRGRRIVAKRIQAYGESLGTVRPVGELDGDIILTAGDLWIAGPRGLVRLRPPALSVDWFSAVPTGVLGARVTGAWIYVSTFTQHNGEFNRIGVNEETAFAFDAVPHVMRVRADGVPSGDLVPAEADEAISQEVWVLPLSAERVLAHYRGGSSTLMTVDMSRNAIAARRSPADGVHRVMTARDDWGAYVVVVTTREGKGADPTTWRMKILDDALHDLAAWSGTGSPPLPAAVIAGPAGRPDRAGREAGVIAFHGAGLRSYHHPEEAPRELARLEGTSIRGTEKGTEELSSNLVPAVHFVAAASGRDGVLFAGLGNGRIVTVTLPWGSPDP
jgi:hypothetical protein